MFICFVCRHYFEGHPELAEQTTYLTEYIDLLEQQLLIEVIVGKLLWLLSLSKILFNNNFIAAASCTLIFLKIIMFSETENLSLRSIKF